MVFLFWAAQRAKTVFVLQKLQGRSANINSHCSIYKLNWASQTKVINVPVSVVTFLKCAPDRTSPKKTDRKFIFFYFGGEPCKASYPLRCVYGRQRLQLWRGEVDAFPFKFLVDLDHPCEVWTAPERISPSLFKAELVSHYLMNQKGIVLGWVLRWILPVCKLKTPSSGISAFLRLSAAEREAPETLNHKDVWPQSDLFQKRLFLEIRSDVKQLKLIIFYLICTHSKVHILAMWCRWPLSNTTVQAWTRENPTISALRVMWVYFPHTY